MSNLVTTASSPVLTYGCYLRDLHELIAQGKGDSEEALALTDRMDGPWYAMTPQEQERMGGLSEDLYALHEGYKRVEMSSEQLEAFRTAVKEAFARMQTGDVDAALTFLRQPAPVSLPPSVIPFLQARCWEKLGDDETALVFMKEADRLDPAHALSVLTVLQRMGRTEELRLYADRVVADPNSTPEELYLAAAALLLPTRTMTDAQARPTLKQVVGVFKRAQADYLSQSVDQQRENALLGTSLTHALALCYERLGDPAAAINICTEALAKHPRDGELLMVRGLALLPTDPEGGLRDLAQAARFRAASIWPYFLLARHALVQGAYGEALRLAIVATEHSAPDQTRAEAHEIIAIALDELGQPQDRVLENFDRALKLDPANERLQANRELAARPRPVAPTGKVRRQHLTKPPEKMDLKRMRSISDQGLRYSWSAVHEQREAQLQESLVAAGVL